MISSDIFLIVHIINHWDFLLKTQHFPACIYTRTKCLQHFFTCMSESFPFPWKCIILWAAIEFKVLNTFFSVCFHQSAFNLASALENRSMLQMWVLQVCDSLDQNMLWLSGFFIENCIQRWWTDPHKFFKIRLSSWLGHVPNLIQTGLLH